MVALFPPLQIPAQPPRPPINTPKILMQQLLCSGYGSHHSNKPDVKNPRPYTQISFNQIQALVDSPQHVDKAQAQWLIPSTLPSRIFKEQEENGEYWLLFADVDHNSPEFDRLVEIIKLIFGDHDFEAYTSKSATEKNQKARIIIPLDKPLCFVDWRLCQELFNDFLVSYDVIPDRSNERAAQLCYLPNRGEVYYKASNRNGKIFEPLTQWAEAVQQKKDFIKAESGKLEEQKKAAISKRKEFKSSDAPDVYWSV